MYKILICFFILSLTLVGCLKCYTIQQTGMVEDLITHPQDVMFYAEKLPSPSSPLISKEKEKEEHIKFRRNFFLAWETIEPNISLDFVFGVFSFPETLNKKWWAENLLPWTDEKWNDIIKNVDCTAYPSRFNKAILLERVSVRSAPSISQIYKDFKLPGEGFPFDYFIMSNLHMGTPVLVLHTSNDGAWFYVYSKLVSGWVPRNAVAFVTSEVMKKVFSAQQVSIIRDNVKFKHKNKDIFVGLGFLGTVLPLVEKKGDNFVVLAPIRDEYGNAKLIHVEIAEEDAVIIPEKLTATKLAPIANGFINQLYGWGGSFGHRDCSEILKDLFIPFGIWLPKHSKAQEEAWNFIPKRSSSEEDIISLVQEYAIPFITFICFKGHMGLYLGMDNGKPIMLNMIWGVTIKKGDFVGRHILGRGVITSINLGAELPYVVKEGFYNIMTGISVLEDTSKGLFYNRTVKSILLPD